MRKQQKLLNFFLSAAAQGAESFYPQRATGSIDSFVDFYFKNEIFNEYSFEDRRKIALIDLSSAYMNDIVNTLNKEGYSQDEIKESLEQGDFQKYSNVANKVILKYFPKALLVSSSDIKKYLRGKTEVYEKILEKTAPTTPTN